MEEKITVAHLVNTLDRIEQWMQALRKGLEALPQDQEIDINFAEMEAGEGLKQPFILPPC